MQTSSTKKIYRIIVKLRRIKQYSNHTYIKGGKKDYNEQKNKALILVKEKLEKYNQFYNFQYKQITIRNQKTRWGSCSKKGNLNFNYKIIFLEEKLIDYIVVHELCHLGEFNHSANFWNLVAKVFPNYLELRRELKTKHVQ